MHVTDYTTHIKRDSVITTPLFFLNTLPSAFRLGPVIHGEHLAPYEEEVNPPPPKHAAGEEGQVLLRDFPPDLQIRSLLSSVNCSASFLHAQPWRKGLD